MTIISRRISMRAMAGMRFKWESLKGEFPSRARALVLEWWSLHRQELEENWILVTAGQAPKWIAPLE